MHATTTASGATRPVLPVRRAGPYRTRLPSSSTKATEAPAVGKRGRDGAVRRRPSREPTLLNQVHTPVPKPSPALPAPVAKIPATSAEASTSAFEKATERVLHNTSGPQLPGAWTPTATPLTSVTGAKMAMRGKKEVKVTVNGQVVSHEFWLADIADSCIIGLDLLKRWGACVDVSRASITLGTETVALQSGPTSPPHSHHSPASKQATPASHHTQATITDHSAPARPLARPQPPACHTATACPAQTSSACRDDSSCPRPVATKQQRARPPAAPAAKKPSGRKRRPVRGAG
ncbi:hypothetical protein SKAU_G00411450 [Synaphobranchus kaupii]|uniref:Uncharacterized protein n=1 Tax=Synaphobranchus kaupii TaxID=118154 RepID=A0A9Q1IBT1_SYNKA|nr:hypothetical protein SKAU_G00411450 [Synaphobranchus kaupii]